MRDRLSWYMVFLILPTILLARSLDKGEQRIRIFFLLEIKINISQMIPTLILNIYKIIEIHGKNGFIKIPKNLVRLENNFV